MIYFVVLMNLSLKSVSWLLNNKIVSHFVDSQINRGIEDIFFVLYGPYFIFYGKNNSKQCCTILFWISFNNITHKILQLLLECFLQMLLVCRTLTKVNLPLLLSLEKKK